MDPSRISRLLKTEDPAVIADRFHVMDAIRSIRSQGYWRQSRGAPAGQRQISLQPGALQAND